MDQNFSSIATESDRGVVQSDNFKSALGVDFIKGESIFSLQLFTDVLIEEVAAYNRDRTEYSVSFLASREMFNDSFKAEVLWVQNMNHGDGIVRPKLSYWLNSNLQMHLSSDIFYGDRTKLFGQFSNRNRISFGFRWGV
jgi:hypothetical protein